MSTPLGTAERVAAIRRRIADACRRAGREPTEVTLVGASKGQPVARLLAAWDAGLRVFGENRVQEAQAKQPHLPATAEWHLLGPLQSNKVPAAASLFSLVHSLDRLKIARRLAAEGADRGHPVRAFLEVNLGDEGSKHGFALPAFLSTVAPIAELTGLVVVGLMAIPPFADDPEASRPWFRRLRELRDELVTRPEWSGCPGLLSMGMSADFEIAVEEGATHVRVGTALFGPRDRTAPREMPREG